MNVHYSIEVGYEYPGNIIDTYANINVTTCQNICNSNQGCVGFEIIADSNRCLTKSALIGPVNSAGKTTYIRNRLEQDATIGSTVAMPIYKPILVGALSGTILFIMFLVILQFRKIFKQPDLEKASVVVDALKSYSNKNDNLLPVDNNITNKKKLASQWIASPKNIMLKSPYGLLACKSKLPKSKLISKWNKSSPGNEVVPFMGSATTTPLSTNEKPTPPVQKRMLSKIPKKTDTVLQLRCSDSIITSNINSKSSRVHSYAFTNPSHLASEDAFTNISPKYKSNFELVSL